MNPALGSYAHAVLRGEPISVKDQIVLGKLQQVANASPAARQAAIEALDEAISGEPVIVRRERPQVSQREA